MILTNCDNYQDEIKAKTIKLQQKQITYQCINTLKKSKKELLFYGTPIETFREYDIKDKSSPQNSDFISIVEACIFGTAPQHQTTKAPQDLLGEMHWIRSFFSFIHFLFYVSLILPLLRREEHYQKLYFSMLDYSTTDMR